MKEVYLKFNPKLSRNNIQAFLKLPPTGSPFLKVTVEVQNTIIKYPQCFAVVDGKLVTIKDPNEVDEEMLAFKRKRNKVKEQTAILNGTLDVNGYTYLVKNDFIQQINLNLSICTLDKDHITALEVLVEGNIKFIEHTVKELLEIAKAYDAKRIRVSKEIYK